MTPTVRRTPLPVGAEITGLDLAAPVPPDTVEWLRDAFDDHHLLVFPGQARLAPEDQVRVAGWFGPVVDERGDGRRWSYVSNHHPEGIVREGPLPFHSDLAFTEEPVLAISLWAEEVPADGAPTRFCDAAAAMTSLVAEPPDDLVDAVADLGSLHVVHAYDLWHQRNEVAARRGEVDADACRAIHPLVLTHPRTGVPILYVSDQQAERVVELDPGTSRALLDRLVAHLERPAHTHEHRWRHGDLVVWDNLAVLHARGAVTGRGPRTLRRVAMAHRRIAELVAAPA